MREKWIARSAETGIIQLVDSTKDGRYLYVTKSKDYDGRASMWHVWQDDKWLICTPNYHLATRKFEEGEE